MEFWIAVALILLVVGFLFIGIYSKQIKGDDPYDHDDNLEKAIALVIFASVFWPVCLAISPFFGLYFLGKYLGEKFGRST